MTGILNTFFASFAGVANDFIPIPAATPTNFGDSFEGGFYTGLIFNQVTQSSTSTTIGTGLKTFTVTDDMAITPLFYSGQSVEVRSRANPATNRMIGTISSAIGTTLIVNVTSVDGSGTLTDWSIMAKYRMIVSPKASGDDQKAWKNANTSGPTETQTLTEGKKATDAMVAADNSTVYPAAHFCNNLTINGYSDWYFPARDELELLWRNLKPATNNNFTTRSTSGINYTNLGSIGNNPSTNGLNENSSPSGAAYTTTVPAQTSVAAFQSGGSESMRVGQIYWSSTELSSSNGYVQDYRTVQFGQQGSGGKTNGFYVRAFRRSII